jgi:hypothetical protein
MRVMRYLNDPSPFRYAALLTLAALAGCGGGAGGAGGGIGPDKGVGNSCAASSDARQQAISDEGMNQTAAVGLAAGRFALPATPEPTQLVVMFHGNHNDSCSWRNHLRRAAERGAVAVAMDYTGQRTEGDIENYGWFVREGAADSIAAAKYFLERYPSITQVFAFGVSMGGNASGMAVASPDAVRADGTPLFDYWVDVEGANNLIEEYLIIRGVAPVNAGAVVAQAEIEEEAGGSLEEVPESYADLTNVFRAPDMAGLEGAVIVHGVDDGLVSTSQSPEMAAALNAVGVPAHLHTVFLRGDGESGSTATSIVAGPLFDGAGESYESPFAGHGWEGSDTHLVMITAFEQLWALMDGATVTPGETPVPGN